MPVVGKEFVVSTRVEWAAVTSPVRFEVVEFLRMISPCSIAELGQAMARQADGLYHHVRVLVKSGLVVRAEDRVVRGRTEAVFDLAARRFRFDIGESPGDGKPPRNAKLAKSLVASLGRMSVRSVGKALEVGLEVGDGPAKQIWGRVETAWLDAEALAEVNGHIRAIDEVFERGRKIRRGRLFTVGVFLGPVVRQTRRRTGRRVSGSQSVSGSNGAKSWAVPET